MATRKTVSALEDPQAAASAAAAVMESSMTEFPDPPEQPSNTVDLPGGITLDHGTSENRVVTHAVVRELNGADEERIVRALNSSNPFHLRHTVIECGTVRLGQEPPEKIQGQLKELLIGDLDALLFGIYQQTYGPRIEVKGWICPLCGGQDDIGFDVSDIPVKKLEKPGYSEFRIDLPKGGYATGHFPNGNDQFAAGENSERTVAERNTIILQRCLELIVDRQGREHIMVTQPSYARQMAITDRRAVLAYIGENQPGPQYQDVKFEHAACGKQVSLVLDLAELFLG